MKKLLVLALVISLVVPLVAADGEYATKGIWELGGTAGFSSTSFEEDVAGAESDTETTLSLAPEAGYFVADNILLAAVLNLKSVTPEDQDPTTTTGISLAPTYVFKGKSESIYPFVGILLGLSSVNNNETDVTTSLTTYGLRGGIKVKLGGNGLLNLGLSYVAGSESIENGTTTDYDLGTLQIGAGFTIFL